MLEDIILMAKFVEARDSLMFKEPGEPSKLWDLLETKKFFLLRTYFVGMVDTDLKAFSSDELLEVAKAQHKLAMKLFVPKLQEQKLLREPPVYEHALPQTFGPQRSSLAPKDGRLSLRGQVLPMALKKPGRVGRTLEDFKMMPVFERVQVLDASNCRLTDADLPGLVDFVDKVSAHLNSSLAACIL